VTVEAAEEEVRSAPNLAIEKNSIEVNTNVSLINEVHDIFL
jgi:hypothetical protein